MIPSLQNRVIDNFFRNGLWIRLCCSPRWFSYVYENTNESSLLRKFVIDLAATFGRDFKVNREFYPVEMLLDLLDQMRKVVKEGTKKIVPANYYVQAPPEPEIPKAEQPVD